MIIQRRKEGETKWEIIRCGLTLGVLQPGYEYRANQLIEPAAPKWPQTTMTEADLARHLMWLGMTMPGTPVLRPVADAAIRRAIETGQVVPATEKSELLAALQSGAKRERELGEALHKATMALAEQPKGVESSLLDGMVERCLPAAKKTLFYGLRFDEMSRDQLLVVALKGWQLLQEARTPIDLACVSQ